MYVLLVLVKFVASVAFSYFVFHLVLADVVLCQPLCHWSPNHVFPLISTRSIT